MIANYDILNPISDKKSPFYNKKKGLFYFHTKKYSLGKAIRFVHLFLVL